MSTETCGKPRVFECKIPKWVKSYIVVTLADGSRLIKSIEEYQTGMDIQQDSGKNSTD